jgi:stalled ribosome rescue protein Dom34
MKRTAGLWIDHRKAFIVTLTDNGAETLQILSGVDKQRGRMDGVRLNEKFESHKVAADDRQQRDYAGHMDAFYRNVMDKIKGSGSILLMGPGEAKGEFKKFMDRHGSENTVVMVEADDKMTDPQIVAKTREYFLEKDTKLGD